MLIDAPKIREGSEIINLTVKSGTISERNALSQPNIGEMFFVIGVPEPFLSFYSGSAWVQVASGFSGGDFSGHVSNDSLHLSPAENADLAQLVGVTSPVQGQLDGISSDLTTHISDESIHITPAQNILLDGITVSAAQINRVANLDAEFAAKVNKAGDIMGAGANLVFNGGTVTGVGMPVMDSDVANKAYVDAHASGIDWKESVVAATTGPITLSGEQIIDDVAVFTGDRVLVKNQAAANANGIYIVDGGTWTRAPDYNTTVKISQSAVYVSNGGTLNGGGSFIQPAVIDIFPGDPITFTAFSGPAINNAGSGIDLAVNGTVSVKRARGLTFDGANALEASVFPGHLILTVDGASSSSQQNAVIGLADTGIIPGIYTQVTVDEKGRVINATSPTTLSGYGITDAQPLNLTLTSLSNLAANGLVAKSGSGVVSRTLTVSGSGISITNGNGIGGNPLVEINSSSQPDPETLVYRDIIGAVSGRAFIGETVATTFAGSVLVQEDAFRSTVSVPANAQIDAISLAAFRTAKYVYQIETAVGSFQSGELMVVHDGTNAFISHQKLIDPSGVDGTFTASVLTGNVIIELSTIASDALTFTTKRTLILAA